MQGSVAPEEGLFNSAAILSEISLLTREEVESKMREYGADGLDDCDRNFDHLINILSTPRTSMVDSSKRLSLTRADWTILRNSTLFCSMFFSTLMRQVSHFPRFLSFSNVFGFTHLNIMYSIGNPQLGLSTRCPRELPTTRCSVWHYTSRQQLQWRDSIINQSAHAAVPFNPGWQYKKPPTCQCTCAGKLHLPTLSQTSWRYDQQHGLSANGRSFKKVHEDSHRATDSLYHFWKQQQDTQDSRGCFRPPQSWERCTQDVQVFAACLRSCPLQIHWNYD